MRKSVKMLIGMILMFSILGVFITNAKSDAYDVYTFQANETYTYGHLSDTLITQKPSISNNYRHYFKTGTIAGTSDGGIILITPNEPDINSKYVIGQYYFDFTSFNNLSNAVNIVFYRNIIVELNDVDYCKQFQTITISNTNITIYQRNYEWITGTWQEATPHQKVISYDSYNLMEN